MQIRDGWAFDDALSGLRLKVVRGEHMDHLHIEKIGEAVVDNRDFYFTHDGAFDGTGSGCCSSIHLEE